ncbi:MAG TPA: hypothetical protein VE054_10570 [Blattabacteriaceae bacterium]|nr:hypothetical protein [Blattabacteriaceae bacterium]
MIAAYFLIDAAGLTWIIVIAVLLVGGYFFIDRLMRKGIYQGRAGGGMMGRMGSAQSELQTLVDPAHRHVMEERERKRGEHDDAGDDPDQPS